MHAPPHRGKVAHPGAAIAVGRIEANPNKPERVRLRRLTPSEP